MSLDSGVELSVPYVPADISQFMVNGFRFSRGDPEAQGIVTEFLVHEHGDRMDGVNLAEAEELTLAAAQGMISSGFHPKRAKNSSGEWVDLSEIALYEVDTAYRSLRSTHRIRDGLALPTPSQVLVAFLYPDLKWIPDYDEAVKHHPNINARDPGYTPTNYSSNTIKHILLGETIRSEEFNAMFRYAGKALFEAVERDQAARSCLFNDFRVIARAHLASQEQDRDPFMTKITEVDDWERLFTG